MFFGVIGQVLFLCFQGFTVHHLFSGGHTDVNGAAFNFTWHIISPFSSIYVKMSIKITARELLFSCVAAPEMIQYYLELGISSENLIETYWSMFHRSTVPVGAGAVLLFILFCLIKGYSFCYSGNCYLIGNLLA